MDIRIQQVLRERTALFMVQSQLSSVNLQSGVLKSVIKLIRVKKEDSAFVYFILESYEGITSYSTLDFKVGDPYRDLELRIPPDFVAETEEVLRQLGDLVYEIEAGAQ